MHNGFELFSYRYIASLIVHLFNIAAELVAHLESQTEIICIRLVCVDSIFMPIIFPFISFDFCSSQKHERMAQASSTHNAEF